MNNMFAALMRCPSMVDGFAPKPIDHGNPWGLTQEQCEVLGALVQFGNNAEIAEELGMNRVDQVALILHRIGKKMGVENRVLIAVKWDRWMREQGVEQ